MSRLLTDFPMKKKRSDDARHIEGWQSKNERIESLLNVLYDFRFNTVKSRTEYRAASSSGLYQPVTKFVLNSFRRRLDATAGIVTSAENYNIILFLDKINILVIIAEKAEYSFHSVHADKFFRH